jgi:hypothetical protein
VLQQCKSKHEIREKMSRRELAFRASVTKNIIMPSAKARLNRL